mmetsp:Transcript_44487/g.102827  ORF Transcript_44487/g.102827 Transcript_44487/m.102827 type:complete len:209 (+) Transcript_44487:76-702(+)
MTELEENADACVPKASARALFNAQQCAQKRKRMQQDLVDLERLLDQAEVAMSLRGRALPRWQESNFQINISEEGHELIFRHLNWILEKCQALQLAASDLEAVDCGSRQNRETSNEYAMLGAEIGAHQHRAFELLRLLQGASPALATVHASSTGFVSQLLTSLFACGSVREGSQCGRCWRGSGQDLTGSRLHVEERQLSRGRDCPAFVR